MLLCQLLEQVSASTGMLNRGLFPKEVRLFDCDALLTFGTCFKQNGQVNLLFAAQVVEVLGHYILLQHLSKHIVFVLTAGRDLLLLRLGFIATTCLK